ncbi:hypothetical protein [Microvirga sp. VF16]|uniref:hypothetical protein n=1 Tax=Microvirga sp. VF16 TaxID=2807101 RepID=UPI00193D0053|nr:hypothetical protein [Microvirga sp. VF16]QRM32149.1 hypothetical protein JO965_23710 [Microvirga sp. VF16]
MRLFQTKRAAAERVRMLEAATRWAGNWVLSGSIVGWGDALIPIFDLVIFLYIPAEVRLARLRARERERFGREIELGGPMYERHQAFLRWAAGYDTDTSGRTLETDANWLAQLSCPVMLMTGECSTYDQVNHILSS